MDAGAKSAGRLAAVAAPEAPAQFTSSLSTALKRDTAVLEVDNPAAPNGITEVPSLPLKRLPGVHILLMLQMRTQVYNVARPSSRPPGSMR